MDIFSELRFHGEGSAARVCWARAIWYVFCQIFAREHAVEESFQPISTTDGYFQTSTLKDICADCLYKDNGKHWS